MFNSQNNHNKHKPKFIGGTEWCINPFHVTWAIFTIEVNKTMIRCLWRTNQLDYYTLFHWLLWEQISHFDPFWSPVTLYSPGRARFDLAFHMTFPFICFITLAVNPTIGVIEIPEPLVPSRLDFISFHSDLMSFLYTKRQDKTFNNNNKRTLVQLIWIQKKIIIQNSLYWLLINKQIGWKLFLLEGLFL